MHPRAIGDLVQLSDGKFFDEVAAGLQHVAANALRLLDDAKFVADAGRQHGCGVTMVVAREEAAKFLILLDAVRCPRRPPGRLSVHLQRFNDHLAKCLYVEACNWKPDTYATIQRYLDDHRKALYLDGMDYQEWIVRNDLLDSRESAIYVDYVATEEGHFWSLPRPLQGREQFFRCNTLFALVQAFHAAGFAQSEALRRIAEIWQAVDLEPDLHWRSIAALNVRTIDTLDAVGLLRAAPTYAHATIVESWTFPLYRADMRLIDVKEADLRAAREVAFYRDVIGCID